MIEWMQPGVNFANNLQAVFLLIFFAKKLQTQTVSTEKLRKTLLYEKAAHKKLVKLAPGTMQTQARVLSNLGNNISD